jgi:recombination protein RecR
MKTFDELVLFFKKFPGIGERQARRFVYYLLHIQPHARQSLAHLITSLDTSIRQCPLTFHYFVPRTPHDLYSPYIVDTNRNHETLLIVEKDTDLENVEATDLYRGIYFVLGGLYPLIEKKKKGYVREEELLRFLDMKQESVTEIIFGLPVNPEGEQTRIRLESAITEKYGDRFVLSVLARGLSTGSELEFIDSHTLYHALAHRTHKKSSS